MADSILRNPIQPRTYRIEKSHRLELAKHGVRRMQVQRGTRVTCIAGTLWVTIDLDNQDIVLERGESFVFAESADVCFAGLEPCVAMCTGVQHSRRWSSGRFLARLCMKMRGLFEKPPYQRLV